MDGLNGLVQTSLAQALMSSPPALAAQLKNMAEKQPWLLAVAWQARDLAHACPEPAKLQHLLSICERLRKERSDWRIVIFTGRKETQNLIGQALVRRDISVGYIRGGQPDENQRAVKQFSSTPPHVHALVSTDAGAEGVNLQAGNVLVNYDLPWNPMIVEQRIGRLQRLGSKHEYVIVWNLVAADSVEERVVGRLMEKLQGIAQAFGDIEPILESPEWESDGLSFEKRVRNLVVQSLMGQNIDEANRKMQESIDKAKKINSPRHS
jgi:superfamily II DNA/RNA helicase